MKNIWKLGMAAALVFAIAATVTSIVAAQTADPTPDATATEESATATPGDDDANSTPDGADGETTKETRKDDYLDALAENLGVSRDELDQALEDTALDMVDKALADGKITQEQADNIKERINSGEGGFFFGGPKFGIGHGFEKGFAHGFHVGVKMEDLAEFLGVDISVIREGQMNGQSLAEIAEANGKSRGELIAHLVANVQEHLDELVAAGTITQEDADEKLANAEEMIAELVDQPGPIFRGGPGHHGGPGHFERHFENGDVSDSSTPDTEASALTL